MKTGYHAVYSKDFFDGINDARKYGFDFVQFDLGVPKFFLNELTNQNLEDISAYANDKGITITFHAPGDNVGLFCDYPIIRKGILDEFSLILEKANKLKARHITFHAGNYSQFKKSGTKKDDSNTSYYEQVLYDNIKYLTEHCGGVLVCIENFALGDVSRRAIKRLIDDGNPLYLTLDTAKLYSDVTTTAIIEEDFELFIQYKDYIKEMHIHDMNKEYKSHQTVGTGTVDFQLFKQFINNNVYLNFEVRPVEAAKISKDNLSSIWKCSFSV